MGVPVFLLIALAIMTSACAPSLSGAGGEVVQPGAGAVTANQMHLEWQAETRGTRTYITGYVYNDYVIAMGDIILLVESLDATGRVVAQTRGDVRRVVAPGMRSFFEVPLAVPAARYRIEIADVRWLSDNRS